MKYEDFDWIELSKLGRNRGITCEKKGPTDGPKEVNGQRPVLHCRCDCLGLFVVNQLSNFSVEPLYTYT